MTLDDQVRIIHLLAVLHPSPVVMPASSVMFEIRGSWRILIDSRRNPGETEFESNGPQFFHHTVVECEPFAPSAPGGEDRSTLDELGDEDAVAPSDERGCPNEPAEINASAIGL